MRLNRRHFLQSAAAMAGSTLARPAAAQAETEISFFYPVAVGGPITKIVDGFAADFAKENPRIKLKPIYAGTYQETIVKALTAHNECASSSVTVVIAGASR
jgi:sn-glycerol 3-phosphate transport system substrate-binding protein